MMTMGQDDMHRRLAMQSRRDAKAYLEMLNQHDELPPPSPQSPVREETEFKHGKMHKPSPEGAFSLVCLRTGAVDQSRLCD